MFSLFVLDLKILIGENFIKCHLIGCSDWLVHSHLIYCMTVSSKQYSMAISGQGATDD